MVDELLIMIRERGDTALRGIESVCGCVGKVPTDHSVRQLCAQRVEELRGWGISGAGTGEMYLYSLTKSCSVGSAGA